MSHLVSGRNKPSLDFIQKILNNFSDLNPTWLIMGTGPMKQLDIFDIKGEVAPIQPIQAKNFGIGSTTEARNMATQYGIEEHELILPDTNKVVHPKPTFTLGLKPELEDSLQKEMSREQKNQAPTILVPPVIYHTPLDLSAQQAVAANASEQPANLSKANHEVSLQTEKSVQNDKKVVKIVFFYSDNTFETFNPQ